MLNLDSYVMTEGENKGKLNFDSLKADVKYSFENLKYDSIRLVFKGGAAFVMDNDLSAHGIKDYFSKLGYNVTLSEQVGFDNKRQEIVEIKL